MAFWTIALLLAGLVAAGMLRALFASREAGLSAGASDVAVYRDQLAEIDRDRARGLITDAEAEGVRIEVSRRLLEADRKAAAARATASGPKWAGIAGAALLAAVTVGGSALLYSTLGAPGYPDLPLSERIRLAEAARADRPGQAEAEAEMALRTRPPLDTRTTELMERLRAAVAERPDDLEGLRLLARYEAATGDLQASRTAQERVIAALGHGATATDYADLLDIQVAAAGGYVSPEAEGTIDAVLALDPRSGRALYYAGLLEAQTGRPDRAFETWAALLDRSTAADPWVGPIRAQIADIAARAGRRYTPPALAPGPTSEDVAAAAEMTPEERAEMIRSMVNGLSDRLAAEGGPPTDWARLISALGVLGQTDRARAIADEAEEVFAGAPDALELIRAARTRAGIDG